MQYAYCNQVIDQICAEHNVKPSDLLQKISGKAAMGKDYYLVSVRREIARVLLLNTDLKQEAVGRLVGLRGAKLGKGAFKGLW
jgi:hypothetical protein